MGDSTVAGFLSPEGTLPPDDINLDALLQPIIVGITGLPDAQVIIKGQPIPPAQPGRTLTWCAFAVMTTTADMNPSIVHDGTGDGGLGTDTSIRQEQLEVMASFYGPASRGTVAALRDGLGIGQNREAMRALGFAYVGMDRVTFVPDLENTQFVRRADLVFRVRRMAIRTYPIRNILSIQGQVIVDSGNAVGEEIVTADFQAGP